MDGRKDCWENYEIPLHEMNENLTIWHSEWTVLHYIVLACYWALLTHERWSIFSYALDSLLLFNTFFRLLSHNYVHSQRSSLLSRDGASNYACRCLKHVLKHLLKCSSTSTNAFIKTTSLQHNFEHPEMLEAQPQVLVVFFLFFFVLFLFRQTYCIT